MNNRKSQLAVTKRRKRDSGFSLMELLVAMAVFMVISGAAFMLVRRHIPLFANQQNQAGLNITLRNAAAQIQLDSANAGTGNYTSSIAAWPVGVTVVNSNPGTGCYNSTTKVYGATCFDTLNIIASDPTVVPGLPSNGAGGSANLGSSNIFYIVPSTTMTAAQLTAYANSFKTGDQLLLVKSDGAHMTSVKLGANAAVVTLSGNSYVKLTCVTSPCTDANGIYSGDPLYIATSNDSASLTAQYNNLDSLVKLAPVTYKVDTTTATNPKLIRQVNGTGGEVVAEQIIGFKVGISTWNGANNTSSYSYTSYSSTSTDWSSVRAIRISIIGRTSSNPDGNFKNTFDQGNYKVEAVSVIVNPRNLSMND